MELDLNKGAYNGPQPAELPPPNYGAPPGRLIVAAVCVGQGYDARYVDRLYEAVGRNLRVPFEPLLITDRLTHDITREGWFHVRGSHGFPGWWAKLNLFDASIYPEGTDRVLYLDLDNVVTDSLDEMVHRVEDFVAISNFGPNWRHSPINSSVLLFNPDRVASIYQDFLDTGPEKVQKTLHGDQCFMWRSYGAERIARWTPDEVISYKYHVRGKGGLPKGAKVVVFHGKPDPHEVRDKVDKAWITRHW